MSLRPLGLMAAALVALACSPAAAQTITSLPLKGADGATYQEAGVSDTGGRFYPAHSLFGWNGSALQAVRVDAATGDLKIICDSGCSGSGGGSGGAVTQSGTWTVNLGTLNGAATSALQQSILTALGSPLQGGGAVTVTGGPTATAQTAANGSLTIIATNTAPSGTGGMTAVPVGSTNGTALTLPAGSKGVRFYLGASDTVTFTIATTAPNSAPAATYTISGASSGTGPNWDESLSGSAVLYVTAKTGAPVYRPY